MNGDKRNFSLSIWDHKDNFICNLKSANLDFEGQSYNENFIENINGEKTLSFSIPMYIFSNIKDENDKEQFKFEPNNAWLQIKNEQKIRYIKYHPITNEIERIEEFILKEFIENRNGEEKIADCTCESLAVYELGKVGWGITFDTNYITNYELGFHEEKINGVSTKISNCSDLLTIDYWMKKLLYKETNLGRVSNTTECTYLLQGLQLRDDDGYPIHPEITAIENGVNSEYKYNRINEPIATVSDVTKYRNNNGWIWEVQAKFENDPQKQSVSTLYEAPVINQFIESYPNYYVAQSYQKRIGQNDNTKVLRRHPIPENELNEWTYVTDIKKRLISEERSNLFSIIQSLCETFEVWADFQYSYNNAGKITQRKILFKTESINEDIKFDFSYGKNLQSVSRNINSNDLITKLYVTNTESNLVDGNVLSIQQATANPTGENYLYNFDYFYNFGELTKEKDFSINSDEYQINLHSGKLRNINNKIINIQKFLAPLYDRRDILQGDLTIEEGSEMGYMDNIQAIQNKIDAIPEQDRIIQSWSQDNNQYNHVGELKTFSATTKAGSSDWYYLNFGREDILVDDLNYLKYEVITDENNHSSLITTQQFNLVNGNSISTTLSGFCPRAYTYNKEWQSGSAKINDDNTSYFTKFDPTLPTCLYDYSEIGDGKFIKGIYFASSLLKNVTYARIRYQYAPLAYYYLLIKDYWDKLGKTQSDINNTESQLLDIKNKITLYELELKKLLKEKNELILQFENKYKPFIREGYWEPSDYQSQLLEQTFNTANGDNFNRYDNGNIRLRDLNLNNSLSTYSYYFSLGNANQIDIDSIKMRVKTRIDGTTTYIPHYQDNNYELYLSGSNLICAIDPNLIYKYDTNSDYKNIPDFYKSEIDYRPIQNGIIQAYSSTTKNWSTIPSTLNVKSPKIYLNNENILTDRLEIYGNEIKESNLLIPYEDYSYTYESLGYNSSGQPVDLSQQESYSDYIQYKYSLRIDFKLTNNTLRFLVASNPTFIVNFGEETTLQYIYNDSVATSKKYSVPKVEYNVSVIDLSSLNGYENYQPKLGQKVPIFDPEMNLYNLKGFITSIDYSLEDKYNTNLTIATYSNKFEDIFQKLTATMSDISYNNNEIYNAINSFEPDGTIKTDVFKKSLQSNFEAVQLGINNEITIDEKEGITLRDKDNNTGVKLIGRGIFLTKDITQGISTEWRTGITGEGINTNALTAGSLDTKQITIWNSSEKQARFIWNENGLFAYGDKFGTSTTTPTSYKNLIDYSQYVKYNQNGLEFNDNSKSALSLGWQGLRIQTQEEALELNATNGLILKQWNNNKTSFKTRLELGKLDNGTLYGLRLSDTTGKPTFQSDSDGNLWLHQYISIGGGMQNGKVNNPTAGIYGLTTGVPRELEMGARRNDNGVVIWDSTPIRFWAGPQTKTDYKNNIYIDNTDITNMRLNGTGGIVSNYFNNLEDNISPSLAKFKVSANGDIVASGINVGGWVGQGSKLRSFNNEAILRSNGYDSNNQNYPLIAIGKPSSADITYGTNYNFRVYQDGSLNIGDENFKVDKNGNITIKAGSINIGNGQFVVTSAGKVTARNLVIGGDQVDGLNQTLTSITTNIANINANITNIGTKITAIEQGSITLATIGGYTHTNTTGGGLTTRVTSNNINYYIGLRSPSTSSDIVFYSGTNNTLNKNEFYVKADGSLKATKADITGKISASSGDIGGWTIDGTEGIKKVSSNGKNITWLKPNSNNDSPVMFIGTTIDLTDFTSLNTTKFAVTGKGAVYFSGGIYGWSSQGFKKGVTDGAIREIYLVDGTTVSVEICQGLIVDIS